MEESKENQRYNNSEYPHLDEISDSNPSILPTASDSSQSRISSQANYYQYVTPPSNRSIFPQSIAPPVYISPGQAITNPLIYQSNPISPNQQSAKSRYCYCAILLLLLLPQIILPIFSLLKFKSFEYCYWEFSLSEVVKNTSSRLPDGNKDHSLYEFYGTICEPDGHYYPQCPELCESLKPLKYSWIYMVAFGIPSVAVSALLFLIIFFKGVCPRIRVPRCFFRVVYCMPPLLYVLGMILYVYYSGFIQNFKRTEEIGYGVDKKPRWLPQPSNLHFETGFDFSIISAILMMLNCLFGCCIVSQICKPSVNQATLTNRRI